MFRHIKEQMMIQMVSSKQQTRCTAKKKQPRLYIECCSKTTSDNNNNSGTKTEIKIEIEIGIDRKIIRIDNKIKRMAIEIEINDKGCVPNSDRNVTPTNPIAVKVDATCQPDDAFVNRMEGCVSTRAEKITFAARINVVMMGFARVLPKENLVRLVVPFVVEG